MLSSIPCGPAYRCRERISLRLRKVGSNSQMEPGTLRVSTDRAIVGIFGGNLFEVPQFFYRMDNYLMYMGLYPEACERLSEALCTFYLSRLEEWLGAVGPYIDVILFGDDLGSQNGPMISPDM